MWSFFQWSELPILTNKFHDSYLLQQTFFEHLKFTGTKTKTVSEFCFIIVAIEFLTSTWPMISNKY